MSPRQSDSRKALELAYDALYYLAEAQLTDGRLTIRKPIYNDAGEATGECEPERPLGDEDIYRARYALLSVMAALAGEEP